MIRSQMTGALVLAVSLIAFAAQAQVRTVTLGITTHCPYGVGGCWAEIKNGLELTNEIAAFGKAPNVKAQTCDLTMFDSWAPDPELFARNFRKMNVGVDVRGVEATVDGIVRIDGTNLVLRLGDQGAFRLAVLREKVQWDVKRNRVEPPTRSERKAFQRLAEAVASRPMRVRVTGPMFNVPASEPEKRATVLEVRKFEPLKRDSGVRE